MTYTRFLAMIATSTVVMFGLMYLNTYALDHIFYSQTRTWMAVYMGAVMAIIMLAFMWKMYDGTSKKLTIVGASLLVFAGSLYLVRSQETVDDVSYMRAMIPHHSIAIMTSERAQIRDPRVRALADDIIEAQVREIAEMKRLIADLEAQPIPLGCPHFTGSASAKHGQGKLMAIGSKSQTKAEPHKDLPEELSEIRNRALARWDNEGGAIASIAEIAADAVPEMTNTELVHLRIRVIALENLMIAVLAEGSEQQRQMARDMAALITPRPGYTQHPLTIHAADHITDLVERADRFRKD